MPAQEFTLGGMPRGVIQSVRGAKPVSALAATVGDMALSVVRRRWWWLIGVAAAGIITAVVFLVAAVYHVIAQYPMEMADNATAWIFGGRQDDHGRTLGKICSPPPSLTASAPPPAPATPDEAAVVPGAELPPPAAPPAPGLQEDGRPTAQALDIIAAIPAKADVDIAQAWILWRLAHPDDPNTAGFDLFTTAYTNTADGLSVNATPMDVAATMDPAADYSPYLLVAQAGAYRMLRQGALTGTEQQRGLLMQALLTTCAGPNRYGT